MVSILAITWNTQSVRLSESLSDETVQKNRESPLSSYSFHCQIPDFLPELLRRISEKRYSILIFSFQEDAYPGSYFHSHLLCKELEPLNYTLLRRTRLIGLGVTTFKALSECDIKARGLRTSIYALNELASEIKASDFLLRREIGEISREHVCSTISTSSLMDFLLNFPVRLVRNKGATASYLRIPRVGLLAIINVHLPFNAKSLLEATLKQNPMLRQNDVFAQNIHFNRIYEDFILNLPVRPDFVLLMGDLNYRLKMSPHEDLALQLSSPNNWNIDFFRHCYLNYDELREQMAKGNIYALEEGVNGQGPLFLPTCKLIKFRSPHEKFIFKIGTVHHRIPSWTDRILYQTFTLRPYKLICQSYQRFDQGQTMSQSDHAMVIGEYEIVSTHSNPSSPVESEKS